MYLACPPSENPCLAATSHPGQKANKLPSQSSRGNPFCRRCSKTGEWHGAGSHCQKSVRPPEPCSWDRDRSRKSPPADYYLQAARCPPGCNRSRRDCPPWQQRLPHAPRQKHLDQADEILPPKVSRLSRKE